MGKYSKRKIYLVIIIVVFLAILELAFVLYLNEPAGKFRSIRKLQEGKNIIQEIPYSKVILRNDLWTEQLKNAKQSENEETKTFREMLLNLDEFSRS